MSADTHTHTHQLMSYELVYTSIHSSINTLLLSDNHHKLNSRQRPYFMSSIIAIICGNERRAAGNHSYHTQQIIDTLQ